MSQLLAEAKVGYHGSDTAIGHGAGQQHIVWLDITMNCEGGEKGDPGDMGVTYSYRNM